MNIKFFAYIRDYTGCKEINLVHCQTVEELLIKLCSLYGKKFENKIFKNNELSDEILILVNGRHIIHLDGINTILDDSDEVCIFPTVAGG